MASGLSTQRDFVFGLQGQGTDWHKKTVEKPSLSKMDFPGFTPEFLEVRGTRLPWQVILCDDDGQPAGKPFDPDSFGYILPQKAFDMITEALGGSRYTVERLGMLWNRSFWFVSIHLDEFATVARQGEAFRLNFSGALDGSDSPQGELSHIRAVCWNTISASRATGQTLFKVRQSRFSHSRLDAAKADVETAVGMAEVFNRTLAKMEEKPATIEQARQAFAGEIARKIVKTGKTLGEAFTTKETKSGKLRESRGLNQVDELVSLFQRGDGNKGETRADILNGYTQFFTRGGTADSQKDVWRAIGSGEFGGNADRKAEFFNVLSDEKEFKKLCADGKEALAMAN